MNLCEGAEGRVKLYIHRLAKPSFEEGGTNAKQRHCSDEARGRKDDRVGRRERSPSPRAIAKDCLRARMPTVWRLGLRVWPPSARGQEREGKSESARLAALERRIEEIRSSIIKAIEERFGGCQLNDPEKRGRDCRSTLPQVAPSTLPRNHQRHPRGNRRRMNGKWWLPKGRE
jgi:hypothetical protein